MSTPTDDDAEEARVRALNARLARNYDQVVYEPAYSSVIDPEGAFGLADLYGCAPPPGATVDVLDIGCGTGSMLHYIGGRVTGRLVGADISPEACAQARQTFASSGDRARILCSDLLDLDAESLGDFDLIYCVGVIGVTPPLVRRKIVDLVGRRLRPGGLMVLSYYAGSRPGLMHMVSRLVRATVDPDLPPDDQIALAKQALRDIGAGLAGTGPMAGAVGELTGIMGEMGPENTFHEILTEMSPVDTAGLEAMFAAEGISFLGHLNQPVARHPTSRQRALAADLRDLGGGGYRYALFARPRNGADPVPLRSTRARWSTDLKPPAGPLPYGQAITFSLEGHGSLNLHHPATQAAFEALAAAGPLTYAQMRAQAIARLAAAGLTPAPDLEDALQRDLETLWGYSLVTPAAGVL